MLLCVISVTCFAFFCRFLIASVLAPIPVFNESEYSKTALRVQKYFKVFSYSLMTFAFLAGTVTSFYQALTTL